MSVTFRAAQEADVASVVSLLQDDVLGAAREGHDMDVYASAFQQMRDERTKHLIVGERDGRIIATYQITFISGLSLRASRRAQIESVRVASDARAGHRGNDDCGCRSARPCGRLRVDVVDYEQKSQPNGPLLSAPWLYPFAYRV